MKKLMAYVFISALCSSMAFAENYNQSPSKYELGQYNFDFSTTKETLPEKPVVNQAPQPVKKNYSSKDSLNIQKEVINQVKEEEKIVKPETNNAEHQIKNEVKKENTENKKTENVIEQKDTTKNQEIKLDINKSEQKVEKIIKTEPNYNNPKKEKKINNKSDKKEPRGLFDFKIMDVQVIPEDSRTIEKL